ncbi:hypothetical protein [Aquirufa rosea]|uniref:Uncharacterized protein n=1 Tax=Aquirufa rosea TaxID=2509241 RepID=A0A4Q1BY12_9BACT|nr:hypothetical protein [Aquirufa rosea]RXK47606.1 hypothetical protein ESB04_10225 [Aquirufa rosea]
MLKRKLLFFLILLPFLSYSQQGKPKKPLKEKKNSHLPYACIFEDGTYPATVIQKNKFTKDSTYFARISISIEGCFVMAIHFPEDSRFIHEALKINDIDDIGNSIIEGEKGNYFIIQAKYEPL